MSFDTDFKLNNQAEISHLSGEAIYDNNHSIVFLNFSFVNKPAINFIVPGFHNFEKDPDVNFFLPYNTEKKFRKVMKDSPLVSCNVVFHGMDGKMIGHYSKERDTNNGGGTLFSNTSNPSTMTELSQSCLSKHQNNKIYYYILSPLHFYSTIDDSEVLKKVLIHDLHNVPVVNTNSDVHLFVDSKFLTIDGKHPDFKNLWLETMKSKGYIIHQMKNCVSGAIQYVFGVKTPDPKSNFNEFINFDSNAEIEFVESKNHEIKVVARNEGRISVQTTSTKEENVKLIAIIKGRVSNVQFLNNECVINSIYLPELNNLEVNLFKYKLEFQKILNRLNLYYSLCSISKHTSRSDINAIILQNSDKICKFMFCEPRSLSDDLDKDEYYNLLEKIYYFTNSKLENVIKELSCNENNTSQKISCPTLNNRQSSIDSNFLGRQFSNETYY